MTEFNLKSGQIPDAKDIVSGWVSSSSITVILRRGRVTINSTEYFFLED